MKLTKEELENRYRKTKNKELAEELGISVMTLLKLIDNAGIERKGSGNHTDRVKVEVI